jgi:hypothetical protein
VGSIELLVSPGPDPEVRRKREKIKSIFSTIVRLNREREV